MVPNPCVKDHNYFFTFPILHHGLLGFFGGGGFFFYFCASTPGKQNITQDLELIKL